jgi:hypothetical protein
MPSASSAYKKIPGWLRWSALVWLLVWVPTYWHVWGPANFLFLCDVAAGLTCIGLWTNNSLLLSSQAVSSLLIDLAWALDAAWRLVFGRHLIGGTEYLFDARFPLWVRLLSLYHLLLPFLLLWALSRVGYDRRGWALQSAIAILLLVLSRIAATPEKNINFAFTDPFFHRAWGPAPVHLALTSLFLIVVVYLPTHLLLARLFPPPQSTPNLQC